MAKNKRVKIYKIRICCKGCGTHLYTYNKEGSGGLVKAYVSGVIKDYTAGDLKCPSCGVQFAREAMYHNRPAHKMIRGKVFIKGHVKK
jgi:hypothetical protein